MDLFAHLVGIPALCKFCFKQILPGVPCNCDESRRPFEGGGGGGWGGFAGGDGGSFAGGDGAGDGGGNARGDTGGDAGDYTETVIVPGREGNIGGEILL